MVVHRAAERGGHCVTCEIVFGWPETTGQNDELGARHRGQDRIGETRAFVTGKSVLEVKEDEQRNRQLSIAVELAPGVTAEPALGKRVAEAITPDYALGGHTASLGLCWLPAGTLPGFPEGMAIGQHGSWNRSTLSGYKVVFVPFDNGRPSGPPRDILSGFLAPDERESYGRPVGVTLGPDGSLLVADDVGDVIWRVTGA